MQALGVFGGGSPSIASPAPFPFVLPALFGVHPSLIGIGIGLTFLAWIGVFSTSFGVDTHFPIRSWVLLTVVSVGSIVMYALGWRYGLEYEGARYVYTGAAISAALGIISAVLSFGSFPMPSPGLEKLRDLADGV